MVWAYSCVIVALTLAFVAVHIDTAPASSCKVASCNGAHQPGKVSNAPSTGSSLKTSADNRNECKKRTVTSAGVSDDKVTVVIDGAHPSSISYQESMFNTDVPRGERGKGSHTTNGK